MLVAHARPSQWPGKIPTPTSSADGSEALSVELTQEQAAALLAATKSRLNERIAIVVNDVAVMTSRVRSPIADGKLEITVRHGNLNRLKEVLSVPLNKEPSP